MDVHFLPSEYHRTIVLLKPLTFNSAKEMFLDKFEYERQRDSTSKARIKDTICSAVYMNGTALFGRWKIKAPGGVSRTYAPSSH